MTTEIWLEGHKLDISKDLDALLTFNVDDIKDFSARNTNFSKTIILPGTQNNNKLLNSIYEINQTTNYNNALSNINTNFNTNASAKCIIFQNNIQIFKGTLKILQIVIDKDLIEYECAVFGELGNLIYALGTNKLDDLDFSSYNHTYDIYSILDTYGGGGRTYYYPLIDYGTYSINKVDWDIKTFRPAIYVINYINKIFDYVKYTYESSFFGLDFFQSLIIPFNQKGLNTYKTTQLGITSQSGNTCMSFATIVNLGVTNNVYDLGSFTTTDNITYTYTGGSTTLVYNYSGDFVIDFNFPDGIDFNGWLKFYKIVGSTETLLAQSNYISLNSYGSNQYTATLSFNTTFLINNGDKIRMDFRVKGDRFTLAGGFETLCISFTQNNVNQINSTIPLLTPIAVGDTVTMNDCVPKNILMKDFLSSIMKMFNLYLYEDSIQNKIIIKPYVDYFDKDLANAKDWTYKLDMDKPITIKPMSEMNAKVYKFQYKDDSDYYNNEYQKRYNLAYGSFKFDTEQEFAQDEKTIDLIFSGTPLVGYGTDPGSTKIYPTIFKRSGTVEECIDSNIRILQTKVISIDKYKVNYIDGTGAHSADFYSYGYAGHFNQPFNPTIDINFGFPYELYYSIDRLSLTANLFNVYWIAYMYEIIDADSRLLIGTFRLNEVDILQLDFSKFIYINGTLFRLNKIEDYDAINRNTCKVELIKVINVEY